MLHELDKDLREIEIALARIEQDIPAIAREAGGSRLAYDLAKAVSMDELEHRAQAEGAKKPTVDVMKAQVTLMVSEEMSKARRAETEMEILQLTLKSLQARLTSVQTRAKMAGIEAGLAR